MPIATAIAAVTPGWSQTRIAQVIGTDQGTVSKMLRGVGRRFSLEQLEAIEDAAGQPRGTILALTGHATVDGVRTARRLVTTIKVQMKDGAVDNVRVIGTKWEDIPEPTQQAAAKGEQPIKKARKRKPQPDPES